MSFQSQLLIEALLQIHEIHKNPEVSDRIQITMQLMKCKNITDTIAKMKILELSDVGKFMFFQDLLKMGQSQIPPTILRRQIASILTSLNRISSDLEIDKIVAACAFAQIVDACKFYKEFFINPNLIVILQSAKIFISKDEDLQIAKLFA